MITYQYDNLTIRTIDQSDISLLRKWLSNPEILKYYEGRDNPHDEQLVQVNFFSEEENLVRCIIEFNDVPIGYIQFYPIGDEEQVEYGYSGFDEVIYGTDQFIGESSYWGKGIGTMLVQSMVDYLINNKQCSRVVMDPQCWNERAIACYEKCGFSKKKLLPKHELHEGEMRDCWLMEYKR